ncbi:hypothetical protein A2Z67_00030 [Candidatus Woesebacteria bacterium RBG_13_36_22]|uniref:Uncharacterized protein n=1 Tax=Candidatus Woesebacteria bacterium RBG_13_36_22 TaxID=1802478 RepID=A0A1F7X8A5_9BACT|nr:MAG: hypothetical protein A2Z67_00030 [Candidatus Woesebacteria bacterium RBG_13_36_22]
MEIEEAIKSVMVPFEKAQSQLIRAEILLKTEPGKKSELRQKFEKFEEDIERAWKEAFGKYGVDHVFDLPKEEYKRICDTWISGPGQELHYWLLGKVAKYSKLSITPPRENPYILALFALKLVYDI